MPARLRSAASKVSSRTNHFSWCPLCFLPWNPSSLPMDLLYLPSFPLPIGSLLLSSRPTPIPSLPFEIPPPVVFSSFIPAPLQQSPTIIPQSSLIPTSFLLEPFARPTSSSIPVKGSVMPQLVVRALRYSSSVSRIVVAARRMQNLLQVLTMLIHWWWR